MSFTYEYERPSVTVDCVVFGLDGSELRVLLIERNQQPHRGEWALPGGFVEIDEELDVAARRELQEETGLQGVFLEQLYTFGTVGRDPRTRVISVAYYALVNIQDHHAKAATDAADAAWFGVYTLPELAFDHAEILEKALDRLKGKVRYQPIGFELLPRKFTLTQLQKLYEVVLQTELDKRNFRKKILAMNLLVGLDEVQQGVAHRAAQLYMFDHDRYQLALQEGFNFEL